MKEQKYTHDQVQVIAKQVGADPNKLWEALNDPLPTKEVVQEVEVDPGEGTRLLVEGEPIRKGDLYKKFGAWVGDWSEMHSAFSLNDDGTCGYSVGETDIIRRPIRLQDKDHRWLDVGEPLEPHDEYRLSNRAVFDWTKTECPGSLVGESDGGEYYRRALEKGVSKSWAERASSELEVGKTYKNSYSEGRYLGEFEVHEQAGKLKALFVNEGKASCMQPGQRFWMAATEEAPFIPCNPPSPQQSQVETTFRIPQVLHGKINEYAEFCGVDFDEIATVLLQESFENRQFSAPPSTAAPQEGEEEWEELRLTKPKHLKPGDKVGGFEFVEKIVSGGVPTFRFQGSGRVHGLFNGTVAIMLQMATVRRRKSKPEPPKTPLVYEAAHMLVHGPDHPYFTVQLPTEWQSEGSVIVIVRTVADQTPFWEGEKCEKALELIEMAYQYLDTYGTVTPKDHPSIPKQDAFFDAYHAFKKMETV